MFGKTTIQQESSKYSNISTEPDVEIKSLPPLTYKTMMVRGTIVVTIIFQVLTHQRMQEEKFAAREATGDKFLKEQSVKKNK